jgi:peptide/nickel transport system permease protein
VRYVAARLGLFLLTLWAALTVNFVLPRVMPGNEARAVLATFHGVSPAALHALEIEFGVNVHQNVLVAYLEYLRNCFTGQFGLTAQQVPVLTEIVSKLPWTLGLVGVTTLIAFAAGTFVGVFSAWRRGSRLDGLLPALMFIVSSFPIFFVGLILIWVFGVLLNLLPLGSNYNIGDIPSMSFSFAGDVLDHAILPAATLVVVTAGLWIYSMRNNMLAVMAEDFVRMGRAKGLPAWRIMFDYAARNAILPNLTGFAMQVGYILGGSILVEYTFSYPGLGYLFFTSTTDHDLPLMQGLFLFYTLAVLVCVLLADLVTAVLDPRTRES